MLRRRRIAGHTAPPFPTVVRTVNAALIRGPQHSGLRSGEEQRRDCAGWLRPAVADALPTLASETAIEPAIGAAGDVRRVRSGRGGYHDDLRLSRIDSKAAQIADLEASARRAPGGAGILALEVSVASGDAQAIGSIAVDGELVRAPRSTRDAVAPGAAAINRGHERAGLESQPRVVPVRVGGTQSSERDECPVSAETTTPTTMAMSPIGWSAPRRPGVR